MKRNKILFTFKIQSFSDVITNSSSELFVFDDKGDVEKVKEILDGLYPDWRSEYAEPVLLKNADDEDIESYAEYLLPRGWDYDYRCKTSEECRNLLCQDIRRFFNEDAKRFYPNIDAWDPKYNWIDDEKFKNKSHEDLTREEWSEIWSRQELECNYEEVVKYLKDNRQNEVLLFSLGENPDWDMQEELQTVAHRYHLG